MLPITLSRVLLIASAASLAGCLGHEKPHAITPAAQVGTSIENAGLRPGQTAPDPTLVDLQGKEVRLSSLRNDRPMLLVFYRGGWCPPCNYQIHTLSDRYPEFRKRNVGIVAVSVEKPEYANATKKEYKTPFVLLSDPDLAAHKAFRVVDEVGGFTSFMLARMGVDLEERSGRTHDSVAIPALFLIDTDGTIRFAHADPDYSTRPSVDQVLAAIDKVHLESSEPPAGAPAVVGAVAATQTTPAEAPAPSAESSPASASTPSQIPPAETTAPPQ